MANALDNSIAAYKEGASYYSENVIMQTWYANKIISLTPPPQRIGSRYWAWHSG
jgi:hypothetical protein